ncbi:hypothetical protein ROI_32250 [Roseburia intestinalis M50/1]|nr:hypothetical protein ROI_32250 [Roseburia intestinalis M50/1]
MAKVYRVQVEILLTADEKALLEHYVKENNRRYKKRGATRNWWTLEKLLQCLLSDITCNRLCPIRYLKRNNFDILSCVVLFVKNFFKFVVFLNFHVFLNNL